jgi:FAD:protein FMN transferase
LIQNHKNIAMKIQLTTFIAFALVTSAVASAVESDTLIVQRSDSENAPLPFVFTHRAMGTDFTITMYPREGDIGYDQLEPIAQEAFQEIDQLESNISSWRPSSDTSRVNRDAHNDPVEVVPDVFELFQVSAQMFNDTGGIFDITVGPLIELWREPLAVGEKPSESDLADTLQVIGTEKVSLYPDTRSIQFAKPGMKVSFGGIGKGLALDRIVPVLKRNGIEAALLSGGDSSMIAIGVPPGESFWKIGIHNPYNGHESISVVELRDQALSTSACYQHLSGETGRPCGIFDPRTGTPVEDMVSATVVTPSGMLADALSTAFYIMGIDGVRDYCARHPEVSAILVPNPVEDKLEPVHIGKRISNSQE